VENDPGALHAINVSFGVVSLALAAVLGLGVILDESVYAAMMCFLGFLALAALSFMRAWMSRSGVSARY
jgi:hypothetical protein